jgi:hypothetical protein
MPRPPKVVSITKTVPSTEQKPKLIARDEETNRIIIGIGSQRMALDFTTRITHLPPNTGDQPAAALPLQSHGADPHAQKPAGTVKLDVPKVNFRGKRLGKSRKRTKP